MLSARALERASRRHRDKLILGARAVRAAPERGHIARRPLTGILAALQLSGYKALISSSTARRRPAAHATFSEPNTPRAVGLPPLPSRAYLRGPLRLAAPRAAGEGPQPTLRPGRASGISVAVLTLRLLQ